MGCRHLRWADPRPPRSIATTLVENIPASENPIGVPALRSVNAETLFSVYLLVLLLSGISLFVRFHRARGEERQQLKWIGYGATSLVLSFVVEEVGTPTINALVDLVAVATFCGIVLIAIFKYRLYDIDRLINRTLVYGLLTALLGGVYAGTVLVLGALFGGVAGNSPSWAVASATLAVAALFQPARRRVQQAVDRRFNRRRYDMAKTVEAFSTRLRDVVDLDTLGRASGGCRPLACHAVSGRCGPPGQGAGAQRNGRPE